MSKIPCCFILFAPFSVCSRRIAVVRTPTPPIEGATPQSAKAQTSGKDEKDDFPSDAFDEALDEAVDALRMGDSEQEQEELQPVVQDAPEIQPLVFDNPDDDSYVEDD